MSDQPTVCCVMLVDGRPEMVRRAIESFRAQTYDPVSRWLLILDTGEKPYALYGSDSENEIEFRCLQHHRKTIGALRNIANACSSGADFIAHFDSDDVSHPRRLEEQVALIQSTGADCVGYREALFWDTRVAQIEVDPTRRGPDGRGCLGTVKSVGQAWIFSHPDPRYVLGASMMYRREAWERCPFLDHTYGDEHWRKVNAARCVGVSADRPRMVCQIHGANTSEAYGAQHMRAAEWRMAPEWDKYCEERMRL